MASTQQSPPQSDPAVGDNTDNIKPTQLAQSHCRYDTDLSPECLAYAENVLGETTEVRAQRMSELQQWLDENPDINAHRDVRTVLHFLRGAKFRLEKAKSKMIKYYNMRAVRPEWFADRDPFRPELVELMDIGVFLPLRVKDDQNRQIFIIRTAAHDPSKHLQNDVFKVGKMILDLAVAADEEISVYGVVAIFDMRGVSLGHAMQLPPSLIKKSVESWECYPTLTKKLEFVNAPFYVNAFLNTFRFFMSDKLKSRVVVNSGPTAAIDSTILPPELGGTGDSYAQLAAYWKEYVQRKADWFVEDDKYKSKVAADGVDEATENAVEAS